MTPRRWRQVAPWPALLIILLGQAGGQGDQYSLLNPGEECGDYYVPNIATETQCFTTAAAAVNLAGKQTFRLDGAGFTGCLFNTEADMLMFGTSAETARLSSWRYVCNGIPTSTTTTTASTITLTTSTITTTSLFVYTGQGFSLIHVLETCAYYKIEDVASVTECFDEARPFVGLASYPTLNINGMGFTGCVFNQASGYVFYGETAGITGGVSTSYQYICRGIATTTTTTTTSTSTTTITTTTTVTTSTTSTSTVTTSTSTLTTSTFTTTTKTTSTSTRTTTTLTGSSSTFTTTTTSSTFTSTTFTETTSTSTRTTMTTTYTEPTGFVGDDPLTIYGGVAKQFWLPEKELVQLLATSELSLLGSAFNYGSEQWINHLVLRGPSGEPVVRVAIRTDIEAIRKGEVPDDQFSTLNITLDWLGGVPLRAIPTPDSFAYQWGNVVFAFMRVPEFYIGEAQVEMMVMEGVSARIVIMSVAGPNSEGEEAHLAARHAHLDFVLHLKEKATCEGILPEIWGLRPFSNATLAMLDVPPH